MGFACRGAGRPGLPPVRAPLADPNAVPSAPAAPPVDAALRIVAAALLARAADAGDAADANDAADAAGAGLVAESPEAQLEALAAGLEAQGADGEAAAAAVQASLLYLRDRVGVPRDMGLPAANQLRAHLNWAAVRFGPS